MEQLRPSAVRHPKRSRRGFTLIEMVIVTGIIAIVASGVVGIASYVIAQARVSAAKGALNQLAHVLQRVYRDTSGYGAVGFWPFEGGVWSPMPNFPYPQIDPRPFNNDDTALMSPTPPSVPTGPWPSPLVRCGTVPPGSSCWASPYMPGQASLGAMKDPWGNSLMYTYVRPMDGYGGGTEAAPLGFVVIWSTGPDGLDQTGCSTGGCSINYNLLAQGLSSIPFCWSPNAVQGNCSDDIVQYVGHSGGAPGGIGSRDGRDSL